MEAVYSTSETKRTFFAKPFCVLHGAQDDRKTENETQKCDFMIHEHSRNDEGHEQIK